MEEKPAAKARRVGVHGAVTGEEIRLGPNKLRFSEVVYLRQIIGWSSLEKLILVRLMLCFLFT